MPRFSSFLFIFLLSATGLTAQTSPTYPAINTFLWGNTSVNAPGQTSFVSGSGFGYRYLLPKNFNPAIKYPAIIYLHGSAESGTDNNAQLAAANNTAHGALTLVATANPDNQTNYPCFFIAPQTPSVNVGWSSDTAATAMQNLLSTFEAQYPNAFDTSRIYLTGNSMGGMGTYDLPYNLSSTSHLGYNPFAALAPMSGNFWAGRSASTEPNIPIWAFHGVADTNVPIATSDDVDVPALRALGYSVIYSRYTNGTHDIWEVAYRHPLLPSWLFSQQLGQPAQGLGNFAITQASQPGGSSLTLSGSSSSQLGLSGISWSDSTTGQSGSISGSLSPAWTIPNITLAAGSSLLQLIGQAPNNSAMINGSVISYGGTLTTNLLYTAPAASGYTNVAWNKPVTASSVEAPGLDASNAVDGNNTTRWSSAYSDPQWIEVDLGANYSISEVDLNWETACGENYLIQTSTDGNSWTTQTTVTGNTTSGLHPYVYTSAPLPVARYVRMYGTARATTWGYSLYELAVYSADLPASVSSLFFQNGASLGMLSLTTTFRSDTWQGVAAVGDGWQERAIADVNGDGIDDMIFQNGTQIGVLLMNADGSAASWVHITSVNAGWELRGAGAITRDGNLDLIFQNGALLGYVEVDNSGAPQSWTGIGVIGAGWQLRAVASLDGTGQPDLIFQNGNALGALQVNTSGVPTAWTGIGGMRSGWTLSDAVDVDGDGQPDLIFQNGNSIGALQVNTSFQPVAWHGMGDMASGWTLPGYY